MKYMIIVLIVLALALAAPVGGQEVKYWEPPTECTDEDREIPGNRQSPCNYVMPEIERAEYHVSMVYPYCLEEMVFYSSGFGPLPGRPDGTLPPWDRYENNDDMWEAKIYGNGQFPYISGPHNRNNTLLQEGSYHISGSTWGLDTRIDYSRLPTSGKASTITLGIILPGNYYGWPVRSNTVPHPDASNWVQMVNTCLTLVRNEKANREHAAALARQEAEEAAKRLAEADAVAKEQEQAIREAEAEARIAQEEIAAALANKLTVAKTELIKTEALVAQIAQEEALTQILLEIVRIRLAGQEDRARITSEYLERRRDAAAEFDEEVAGIEERIQAYLDFNDKLMASIEEYQNSIQNRMERLHQDIEIQKAKINILEEQAREIAVPPTPTATPSTAESASTGDN